MYVSLVLLLCCIPSFESAATNPNFVFVLTDDQDLHLHGLVPMEKTLSFIANEGMVFQNAFVNTPVCCPSRSTILTGKYAHNIQVYNNSISGNCSSQDWQNNHEPFTVAAVLKEQLGYNTFYAGKYLNQYGMKRVKGIKHVPKGYDWWIGLKGNSKYYNYTLSINGTRKHLKHRYLTDVILNYALDFLNQDYITRNPFFMILAPPAPHAPFTPAKRHMNKFPSATAVRNPAFNFTPIEKHWVVRMSPSSLPQNVTKLDEIQQNRLRTLLAVDEMVANVIQKLKSSNVLDNTYIIFSSDNGFHIGQFTQPWDKRQPYQTDVNIPFFIRGPNISRHSLSRFPISFVDVAPTILDLANVDVPRDMDGQSFKQELFYRNCSNVSKTVFIEYWGEGNIRSVDPDCHSNSAESLAECTLDNWCKCQDAKNNTFTCKLDINNELYFKFCQFSDDENFFEAYDLLQDPFELKNIFKELDYRSADYHVGVLNDFKECYQTKCSKLAYLI